MSTFCYDAPAGTETAHDTRVHDVQHPDAAGHLESSEAMLIDHSNPVLSEPPSMTPEVAIRLAITVRAPKRAHARCSERSTPPAHVMKPRLCVCAVSCISCTCRPVGPSLSRWCSSWMASRSASSPTSPSRMMDQPSTRATHRHRVDASQATTTRVDLLASPRRAHSRRRAAPRSDRARPARRRLPRMTHRRRAPRHPPQHTPFETRGLAPCQRPVTSAPHAQGPRLRRPS